LYALCWLGRRQAPFFAQWVAAGISRKAGEAAQMQEYQDNACGIRLETLEYTYENSRPCLRNRATID
jgi:hypothetical protein